MSDGNLPLQFTLYGQDETPEFRTKDPQGKTRATYNPGQGPQIHQWGGGMSGPQSIAGNLDVSDYEIGAPISGINKALRKKAKGSGMNRERILQNLQEKEAQRNANQTGPVNVPGVGANTQPDAYQLALRPGTTIVAPSDSGNAQMGIQMGSRSQDLLRNQLGTLNPEVDEGFLKAQDPWQYDPSQTTRGTEQLTLQQHNANELANGYANAVKDAAANPDGQAPIVDAPTRRGNNPLVITDAPDKGQIYLPKEWNPEIIGPVPSVDYGDFAGQATQPIRQGSAVQRKPINKAALYGAGAVGGTALVAGGAYLAARAFNKKKVKEGKQKEKQG